MKTMARLGQRGQDIVEFAITLAIFLMIVIIMIDLGVAIYAYTVVQNSAREGARYGIIYPTDTDGIRTAAIDRAIGLSIGVGDVDVETIDYDSPPDGRDAIRVTVRYQFTPLTPFAAAFLPGGNLSMTGLATMRIEE